MLTKLIAEIQTNNTLQPAVLAERLSTTTEMVTAMLDQLGRLGVVKQVNLACGKPCGGCPLSSMCGNPDNLSGRLWHVKLA